MDPALLEFFKTLGQAAIFAYAARVFYTDGRAQDKIFIAHLQEQNRMLFAWIQRITFLRSPAIMPDSPSWMGPIPTDLEGVQSSQKSPAIT